MQFRIVFKLGSALFLSASAFQSASASPETPDAEMISRLIEQLGARRFADREAAGRELVAIGEPAMPALRHAFAKSDDPEVRLRAKATMRKIMLGVQKSRSTDLKMVLIDDGQFLMGSASPENGRRPDEARHEVRIGMPFLLGAYEVTQDEYKRVMKSNPSWFSAIGDGKAKVKGRDTSRFPVEQVSWFDAIDFCNRLSQLDGYLPYYKLSNVNRDGDSIANATVEIVGGNGYRLPTEAEWEFACRASTPGPYHYGRENTGKEANLKPGPATGYGVAPDWPTLERTTDVGSYPANHWHLYDMHGNAAEWCQDWYEREYPQKSPLSDPTGPVRGTHRVTRGGSWLVNEGSCRSASRASLAPGERSYSQGFRVARSP